MIRYKMIKADQISRTRGSVLVAEAAFRGPRPRPRAWIAGLAKSTTFATYLFCEDAEQFDLWLALCSAWRASQRA
jgi:hypothetical protein